MKKTALMLAAVATFGAGSAIAMTEELTMLEAAVSREFESLGLRDVLMTELTLGQLELIKRVIESDDNNLTKKQRIEAIMAR